MLCQEPHLPMASTSNLVNEPRTVHVEAPRCRPVASILFSIYSHSVSVSSPRGGGGYSTEHTDLDGCGFTLSYTGELTEASQIYLKGLVAQLNAKENESM